ncbi:metal ABC transporter permease [Nocardia sp. BMG111209]|uniref:metal ABC transporter permease n=1 Tax=Nocardia sp. BMG111209 TaxID=1160137 RepID=UPI0003807BC3|nr:metal ABC transporter permease [Nocardia sp. BMG111209]
MTPHLYWNPWLDLRQMLSYPFMVNAFRAGTIVAVVAGAVGWVMVLRREAFAGHTLAVLGFPGAAAATWLGIASGYGSFASCATAALVIGALPAATRARGSGEQSAVIGTVQAFALAAGMLFVSLYHGFLSGLTNLLFGTIAGVTTGQVLLLLAAGTVCLLVLLLSGRPLLWSSIDPKAAAVQGIPTRVMTSGFLVLLGIAAAGAGQVTGALLVFALLVAPPAAAHRLTTRPGPGIACSVAIALTVTWLGLSCAFFSSYPIGFWVSTFAFTAHLASTGLAACRDRRGGQRPGPPGPLREKPSLPATSTSPDAAAASAPRRGREGSPPRAAAVATLPDATATATGDGDGETKVVAA